MKQIVAFMKEQKINLIILISALINGLIFKPQNGKYAILEKLFVIAVLFVLTKAVIKLEEINKER